MTKRELKLIEEGTPCVINYFDRNLLTVSQAKERGQDICPNYSQCEKNQNMCALQIGLEAAKYTMQKGNLKKQLYDFYDQALNQGWFNEELWDSINRRDFKKIKGKGNILRAVEGFARIVLLKDPFESFFPGCERCEGIKLEKIVHNSVWVRGMRGAGTGEVKTQSIPYCPDCDPEPKNGIVYDDEINLF